MTRELLSGFPVVIELPIQWGDMDAYGHVNNTVFFRFFESARIAFLDRCGFLAAHGELEVGAILHSTACRFRRPLFYPDTISVGARASEVLTDRFIMEYKIVSHSQDEVVAEGTGTVVSFDYNTRSKTDLPEMVREGLARLR
ncbi:MAG: acyl-CoA thioesterase [Gemmatimonadetes bacterium]|nr:acyl-CoA thioesterase [Gemmatimonadota bacterium]MCH7490076.1 acyl-CoA thioesterase [Gemmatimonadota bacterium]